ncbi:MAG TPA: helix-turn-helix domain-containing protein [Syntrophorhabdaceae bacterium]|mgnify:CR=1 FL=1|nr:helix-turn-helix domain-containing protein [Syntrophorhabdaceae bacterium]
MTNITKKRLMDVKEAVFYLSISRATLYRLVENNDVKSILIGKRRLFDVYDLDDFIEALKN